MNRNKSVKPSYGPSTKMVPVILSRRTQNYTLSLARSRGVDTKITEKEIRNAREKIITGVSSVQYSFGQMFNEFG